MLIAAENSKPKYRVADDQELEKLV